MPRKEIHEILLELLNSEVELNSIVTRTNLVTQQIKLCKVMIRSFSEEEFDNFRRVLGEDIDKIRADIKSNDVKYRQALTTLIDLLKGEA